MAELTGKTPDASDRPKAAAPKATLAPAGESTDPDVHRLLAERQAALSNLAAATPSDDDKAKAKAAREQVEEIDAQLADLGVTAG